MEPPAIIADRFELEAKAGAGSMGLVFRARDRLEDQTVAVKVLRAASARLGERFEREAVLLESLSHPHVVRLVARGVTGDGSRFLAMEWLEGEDLAARLAREPLTVGESVDLGIAVADALGAAHAAGVVHRDVKPSNLFLVGGDPRQVKVVDFGIARWQRAAALTVEGAALGTPGYMAPEQARGAADVSACADVFALGCVLYECLTGKQAFRAEHLMALLTMVLFEEVPPARSHAPELPEELDAYLASMLEKDPDRRPADGAAVATALRELRAGLDPEASGRRAAQSERPPSLTEDEQRLVSLVVAGSPEETAEATDTLLDALPQTRHTISDLDAIAHGLGGTIDRLASGGIVVLFQSLGSAAEQATRAGRCALALHDALPNVPIAVATGAAVLSGGVSGDCIARAFEILRGTREGQLRVDEATESLLAADLVVSEGVLEGERRARSPARRVLGRESPFVGRQPELVACTAAWEECEADSVANVVLLTGHAGTGKSRLLHEALGRIDADVWSVRCAPLTASSALGTVARMIRAKADLVEGASDQGAHEDLKAWVARYVGPDEVDRIAGFIGEIAGAPASEPSMQVAAARGDPFLMGEHVRRAVADLFDAASARAPVVISLEDVHWADGPSLKLLDQVIGALRDRPLLILATARPELEDLHPTLWKRHPVTRLPLRPLPPRVSERLLAALLPDATDAQRAALAARAGGNPFHLEELARATAQGHGDQIPKALVAVAQARVERLPIDARRILRGASAFGETFPSGGVASMLGAETIAGLDERLAELEREEILVREPTSRFVGETEWSFRHAILHDAAYAMLTESNRALAHRLAGKWLAAHGESDPLLVARQLERGEVPAEAVPHYLRASKAALDASDYGGALASARRALALGAEGEEAGRAHALAGEACHWLGRFVEGAAEADRALAIFERGSVPWLEAAATCARLALRTGETDRAAELAREMPATGGLPLSVALAHLAMPLIVGAHSHLAESVIDRLAGETDPTVVAPLQRALAHAAMERSDMVAYLAHTEAALRAFEALGHEGAVAGQRSNVAYGLMQLGRHEEAEHTLRSVLEDLKRPGMPAPLVGVSMGKHGEVLRLLGRLEEAKAVLERAVPALEAQGDPRMESGARIQLAQILARLGESDAARREAERSLALVSHAPSTYLGRCGEVALILLDIGDVREATELATRAHDALEAGAQVYEGGTAVLLAYLEAMRAAGRDDEARRAKERLKALIDQRAACIADPAARAIFLARAPYHDRALALLEER